MMNIAQASARVFCVGSPLAMDLSMPKKHGGKVR
jgi:hypothetical protein